MTDDEIDAGRYRWAKANAPQTLAAIAWGHSKAATAFADPDAAIDAAMAAIHPLSHLMMNARGSPAPDLITTRIVRPDGAIAFEMLERESSGLTPFAVGHPCSWSHFVGPGHGDFIVTKIVEQPGRRDITIAPYVDGAEVPGRKR